MYAGSNHLLNIVILTGKTGHEWTGPAVQCASERSDHRHSHDSDFFLLLHICLFLYKNTQNSICLDVSNNLSPKFLILKFRRPPIETSRATLTATYLIGYVLLLPLGWDTKQHRFRLYSHRSYILATIIYQGLFMIFTSIIIPAPTLR